MTYKCPQIQIQGDTLQVLLDVKEGITDETVWLRINDEPFSLNVKTPTLMIDDTHGIKLTRKKGSSIVYTLSKPDTEDVNLVFPVKYHNTNTTANITSVSCVNDKVMFGTSSGDIIKTSMPIHMNITKPIIKESAHFADVSKLVSFTSGVMLMSVGLDMQIKIWKNDTADSGFSDPVRILNSVHKGRVTDVLDIGRGRNVVSCGLDAQLLIWELGTGKCVWKGHRIRDLKDGYTSLCIFDDSTTGENIDPFYECTGKTLWCGHSSGFVSLWDLSTRLSLGEFQSNDDGYSVERVDCIDAEHVVVGLNNGDIFKFKYDTQTKTATQMWLTNLEKMEVDGAYVNVKQLKVFKDSVIVLTDNMLVRLSLDTGKTVDAFVGYDETINTFIIKDDHLIAVGKRGLIVSFKL